MVFYILIAYNIINEIKKRIFLNDVLGRLSRKLNNVKLKNYLAMVYIIMVSLSG